MLALLGSDLGAQFSVCQLLTLRDMRALHVSCSSWRRWIDALPVSAITPTVQLRASCISTGAARRSRWASRWIDRIAVKDAWPRSQGRDPERIEVFFQAVNCIPAAFPLLRELQLTHVGMLNDVPALATCFVALQHTLQVLSIRYVSIKDGISWCENLFTKLLRAMEPLLRLRSLNVDFSPMREPRLVEFAPLARLGSLETLILGGFHGLAVEQLRHLAACPQLTHMEHGGGWSDAALDQLAKSRLSDAAPIRQLDSSGVRNAGVLWPHIVQFPGLTFLTLRRAELSVSQWQELPRAFPQLCRLELVIDPPKSRYMRKEPSREEGCDTWLLVLRQCEQLRDLHVTHAVLSQAQWPLLAPVLPRLHALTFDQCELPSAESIALLSSAIELTSLRLLKCEVPNPEAHSFNGYFSSSFVDWRLYLPSLPRLRKLQVPWDGPPDVAAEAHVARRRALIDRMPLLAEVNFKQ